MNLNDYSKSQLIALAKQQNIALGDYARKTKDEIIATLVAAGVPAGAEPIPEQPKAEPVQHAAEQPKPASGGKTANLQQALRDLLGEPQIDEHLVRTIAEDVVEKAKAGLPTRVETIVVQEGKADIVIPDEVSPTVKAILRKVEAGVNVLLVGPAGCGKTTLAQKTAEVLGKRFVSISCQVGMSISNFNGWLLPTGEGGKFSYVSSEFVDAYEKGDAVILIDEIDAADSNMLLVINSALANGHMSVPQRFENPTVKRGAGVVIIATANTFGKGGDLTYVGRERLDEATLDRFRAGRIVMDYDAKFEKANVNETLLSFAKKVRGKLAELKLRRILSTRWLLDATSCMAKGETFEEAIDTFFVDWSADDRAKVW